MEAVASIFAVLSLTIQLIDTVSKLNRFLRSVQGAPHEIVRLIEDLDHLRDYLDHAKLLAEQHQASINPPGSTATLLKALNSCRLSLEGLADLMSTVENLGSNSGGLRRTWSGLKVVSKKGEIQQFQGRIQTASSRLHFAITLNVAFMTTE